MVLLQEPRIWEGVVLLDAKHPLGIKRSSSIPNFCLLFPPFHTPKSDLLGRFPNALYYTNKFKMGLGVLEQKKLPHVPGTVLLNDKAAHAEEIALGLKHGTGRNSHIVLSPQPAEDPNDPLNWPAWKKEVIIAILCLGAMLNAGTNGIVYS